METLWIGTSGRALSNLTLKWGHDLRQAPFIGEEKSTFDGRNFSNRRVSLQEWHVRQWNNKAYRRCVLSMIRCNHFLRNWYRTWVPEPHQPWIIFSSAYWLEKEKKKAFLRTVGKGQGIICNYIRLPLLPYMLPIAKRSCGTRRRMQGKPTQTVLCHES